jgi:hypothetical protein
MKPLTSAAVFGLVPVPPMPVTGTQNDSDSCADGDIWPVPANDANAARLAELQYDATERMATNDELARIRQELDDSSAESRL